MATDRSGGLEGGDELLAEIYREFRDGLPARLETIRVSLEALAEGYDSEAAESFYRTAHSLKGTAPAFGAHGLVAPATALADAGRRWFEQRELDAAEASAAFEELEQLRIEVERYSAEVEGDAAG
jgi:HPt (histidine-containing phosphotransfer) domain-containing protein